MDNIEGCICKGNWRAIIEKSTPFFNKKYLDRNNEECTFVGVVHAEDDYYYLMWNMVTGKSSLLSCVGNIEGFGYNLMEVI